MGTADETPHDTGDVTRSVVFKRSGPPHLLVILLPCQPRIIRDKALVEAINKLPRSRYTLSLSFCDPDGVFPVHQRASRARDRGEIW